jgi:hypothetical protein
MVTSTDPTGGAGDWNSAYVDRGWVCIPHGCPGDAFQAEIESVSCPSVALCWASGDGGAMFRSEQPAGGASAWSAPISLESLTPQFAWEHGTRTLACPSITRCVAVRESEANVMTPAHEWGPPAKIDPWAMTAEAISCPSEELCFITMGGGDVIVGHAVPTGTTTQQTSPARRRASQHITFSAAPKPARPGHSYKLRASSSAKLPVSVVSKTPAICKVAAGTRTSRYITVHLRARGTCRLLATQAGTPVFEAAVGRLAFKVKPAPKHQ